MQWCAGERRIRVRLSQKRGMKAVTVSSVGDLPGLNQLSRAGVRAYPGGEDRGAGRSLQLLRLFFVGSSGLHGIVRPDRTVAARCQDVV